MIIIEILVAIAATISFSALFGVPRQYYPLCGIIGSVGWEIYSFLSPSWGAVAASFLATAAVIFLSRLAAIWQHCPVTIFLISGIFPLVPGTVVYWTAYYLVTDQLVLALETGYLAVKIAFAIVLGIVVVFELPQGFFLFLLGRRKPKTR
jgi:uncharacterized membrane protein YjjB (DUF3815 family)